MHGHHFAEHQPGGYGHAVKSRELHDLRALAFHAHRAFGHARWLYLCRCQRRELGQCELVHLGGHGGAALVHGFGQRMRGEVPHKLTVLFDVGERVFASDARETDDRRRVVERVEEAVRREIEHTGVAARGDPADGAGPDDGVERIVRQAVALAWEVAVEAVVGVGHGGKRQRRKRRAELVLGNVASILPRRSAPCVPSQMPVSTICSSRSDSAARCSGVALRRGPSMIRIAMPCTADHARYSAIGRRARGNTPASAMASRA